MSYRTIGILALLLVLWIGYHLLDSARERSRVERLPRKVALLGPYSARAGITEARRIASLWDADCQLQSIALAFGGDVLTDDPGMGPDGIPIAPSGWNYRFYSAARGWFLDLTLWPDGRCEASSFDGINYRDTKPLPEEFLDSSDVLSIAEKLYGKRYRKKGKLFRLPTHLTTWPSSVVGPKDPVPHRPTWHVHYLTTREQDRVDLYLTFDALTGEELCAVEAVNSQVQVLTNNYHQ
jgi:hypothetical protein